MSRSRKDAKGGHAWPGYDRENKVVKDATKRERRRDNDRMVRDYIPCPSCNDDGVACDLAGEIVADPCWCIDNEKIEPGPERSSQGWRTWAIVFILMTGGVYEGRGDKTQTPGNYEKVACCQPRTT